MRYQNDAWLSERLHKNVFSLQVSPEDSQSKLPSQEIVSPAFIYSKVPMQSTEIFSLLINNNFKIIDINVQLSAPLIALGKSPSSMLTVRHANIHDEERLISIAYDGFSLDRFHADPEINDEDASQIKADWVQNYLLGKRGDFTLVVQNAQQEILGFLLLIINTEGDCIIDLIAMDMKYRGQGAGSVIIRAIHNYVPSAKRVLVGTQLSNYGSINFYSKLGFKIESSTFMLHKHL
jgi:ribosomal protein S18 acetylase RimI-like enzyme